jgi:hypothetical protein
VRAPIEHSDEDVDDGRSQPDVPLTVATIPMAAMPSLAEAQRQQEDQQQQTSQRGWLC